MIFTVHVPRNSYDPVVAAERARFIRDGFSWPAFLFGPLWLLWNRSVTGFFVYLTAVASFLVLQLSLGLTLSLLPMLIFLLSLFVGFEGSTFVRWSMDRKRYRCVDIVSALSREEAEHQILDRWMPRMPPQPVPRTLQGSYQTFGLFSDEAG